MNDINDIFKIFKILEGLLKEYLDEILQLRKERDELIDENDELRNLLRKYDISNNHLKYGEDNGR